MKFFFMSLDIWPFLDNFKNSTIIGGAEKQQYFLINELLRQKHDVLICTNVSNKPQHARYEVEPILSHRKYLKYYRIFLHLLKFNPDVVYLRSPSNLGAALVAYTFLFRKKMVFFSAHDTDFEPSVNLQGYNPFVFSLFIRFCDYIFVQNKVQKDLLKNNFKKNGIEIGNIIEINEKRLVFNLKERKYFLWIGRIEPFKRIESLFEIAQSMLNEKFVAIAPANVKNEYSENTIECIKKIKNIDYVGFVKPENISEYLKKAKGLICTSEHEGFSNTFLEAWNNGTPVFTMGVDPNKIINKSGGKLGYVFSSSIQFVNKIYEVFNFVDSSYMYNYLDSHHCLETNVSKFMEILFYGDQS